MKQPVKSVTNRASRVDASNDSVVILTLKIPLLGEHVPRQTVASEGTS